MPHYRITIWTRRRKRPYSGIRLIKNYNIDAVQSMVYKKAQVTYADVLIDVEVQMLPKTCKAVKSRFEADLDE
jgi:hypothetical protein